MKSMKVSPLEVIRTFYIGNELLGKIFKSSGGDKKLKATFSFILMYAAGVSRFNI